MGENIARDLRTLNRRKKKKTGKYLKENGAEFCKINKTVTSIHRLKTWIQNFFSNKIQFKTIIFIIISLFKKI